MTTLEMIDKIEKWTEYGSESWTALQNLRERVESERAALQAAVDEIAAGVLRVETNVVNGADARFGDGAIAAYRDALDELARAGWEATS